MPPRTPESVHIAIGYAEATYDFSWRPMEPGILVRVAFDAAEGRVGETALTASRPADVARVLDVLRRLIVALPGPPPAPPVRAGGAGN